MNCAELNKHQMPNAFVSVSANCAYVCVCCVSAVCMLLIESARSKSV